MKKGQYISRVHLKMVREKDNVIVYGENMTNPAVVVEMMSPIFEDADREIMAVISLSASMEPVAFEVVAVGGVTSCMVDVKNLFKHALLANASNIICIHNHPSQNIKPSSDDEQITQKIKDAGKLLDIELQDHIIYGNRNSYYSFREHNWN